MKNDQTEVCNEDIILSVGGQGTLAGGAVGQPGNKPLGSLALHTQQYKNIIFCDCSMNLSVLYT